MDALVAAPEFHKAVFENDHIRLLEVTVNPGVSERCTRIAIRPRS
jgi:hypothetical protein